MSRATILAPNEGAKYWVVGDHHTIKAGAEQTDGLLAVTVSWLLPGISGPPPHIHLNEDEMFYVIQGQAQFIHDKHTVAAGPGSTVYIKKGTPHTFSNVGTIPLSSLVVTTPSGFESFVAECGERIDSIPSKHTINPAAIQKLLGTASRYGIEILPDHRPVGEAPSRAPERPLWVWGNIVTLKLNSADTDGNFCVAEVISPPGAAVQVHSHREMDEFFLVLEGEYEFTVGGRVTRAPVGTFIHVPHGIAHGFKNASSKPAKMADFHTPGGFEKFFEEAGVPCADASKSPQVPPMNPAQIKAFCDRHGMDLI